MGVLTCFPAWAHHRMYSVAAWQLCPDFLVRRDEKLCSEARQVCDLLSYPCRAVEWAPQLIGSLTGVPNRVEMPTKFLGQMRPSAGICARAPPRAETWSSNIHTLVTVSHILLSHLSMIPGFPSTPIIPVIPLKQDPSGLPRKHPTML